jgi:hypothetical protein
MKLVIDLQGAQSGSRNRGIGRYSLALAQAIVRQAGKHEVWIALSNTFPATIEPLRASFENLMPQHRIVVWDAPMPVTEKDPGNTWRRQTGEILREAFLAGLKPDLIHVSSLFEGQLDDAITSIGHLDTATNTAVTLYDLIPLIYPDQYLPTPASKATYQRKLASLKRATRRHRSPPSATEQGRQHLDRSGPVFPSAQADGRAGARHPPALRTVSILRDVCRRHRPTKKSSSPVWRLREAARQAAAKPPAACGLLRA